MRKQFHSAEHYNKIMREASHSRVPKYALPQRIPFNFINDINSTQTCLLNDGFTFCEGDRKSIGVRRINLTYPTLWPLNMKFNFSIGYATQVTGFFVYDANTLYSNRDQDTDIYRVTCDVIDKLVKVIKSLKPDASIREFTYYEAYTQSMRFGIQILDVELPNASTMSIDFTTDPDTGAEFYNQDPLVVNATQVLTNETDSGDNLYQSTTFEWTFHHLVDTSFLQVSASFNPYSQFNIIGGLQEVYHNGPMLFPYDRNPEVVIKICDQYGIPIHSKDILGYIDLDLIVDNSASYAIDD
jgi:hypothetical protein